MTPRWPFTRKNSSEWRLEHNSFLLTLRRKELCSGPTGSTGGSVLWPISTSKSTKKSTILQKRKVFFIEKTRAVDNFNLDFYSFFRFLGWPPAENNRLGDTFSIYFIFFEWSFSRENSSGGQLFSKKKRRFLAWTEILARVFSKKRHFSTHRESAGVQAFSNP